MLVQVASEFLVHATSLYCCQDALSSVASTSDPLMTICDPSPDNIDQWYVLRERENL
jgi:hypothetical protein